MRVGYSFGIFGICGTITNIVKAQIDETDGKVVFKELFLRKYVKNFWELYFS